jgi:hypothetical protein
MPRGNIDNLIPNSKRSPEELREMTRKGGIASGEARRAKRDMRERMKIMLEEKPKGKDYTYADRLTESMLTIAANPKNGAAAVRAYETILHIIGQDEPEARQDALDTLRQILEVNMKNARLQTEQETE